MKGISGTLEGALGSQGVDLAPLGTWSEQDKRELKVVNNTLSSSQFFSKANVSRSSPPAYRGIRIRGGGSRERPHPG